MKNHRIGIMTFYFVDNYGALLQCIALQEKCKQMCNDVGIIKYCPSKMVGWKPRIIRLVSLSKHHKKYNLFRLKNLNIVSKRHSFDTVIVGSDQVWNPDIIGYDDNWIKPKVKYKHLCSYAPSFGKLNLNNREMSFIRSHEQNFKDYSLITVRENNGKRVLEEIGVNAQVVCDPTLLFFDEPEFYAKYANISTYSKNNGINLPSKYILVYSLEHSDDIDEIALSQSKIYDLPVIAIHPTNKILQNCDRFLTDASPSEFLYLIQNASSVITNSFHGLAFSYIFRKKVFSICHSTLSSRQIELIENSFYEYNKLSDNIYYIDTNQDVKVFKKFIDDSNAILHSIISLSS